MDSSIMVCAALGSVAASAQAASYVWTGSAGDGIWNNAANWDNGVPSGADAVITINNGGTIRGTWSNMRNGSITITGDTHLTDMVKIDGLGQINIGLGGSISTGTDVGMELYGDLNLNGTLTFNHAVGVKYAPANWNLTEFGQVVKNTGNYWWPEGVINITGVLDIGDAASAVRYETVTRDLVVGSGRSGGSWAYVMSNKAGGSLNQVTLDSDIEANAANLGNYKMYEQDNKIYVSYVRAVSPIPEPATASLSLLGLFALAARRRRV